MNIGLVIPQIFYDLIARITPGLAVILMGLFVWGGNQAEGPDIVKISGLFAKENSPVVMLLFVFLFASYLLAFMLDGMWGLLPYKLSSEGEGSHDSEILADFKTLDPSFDATNYQFPGIALRYDAVRLKDANVGARLAKLRAELHMCRVLILGLSILGLINLKNLYPALNWATVISEALIILGIMSFIKTHGRLKVRFIWGICNHWLLLVRPGNFGENKSQRSQGAAKAGCD